MGIFTPAQLARALHALRLDREAPLASGTPKSWALLYLAMRQHADPSQWPRASHHRGRRGAW